MQTGGLRTRGITKKSTEEKPLITVVTVVYNGEATLEKTIQSVVNQAYDNVEYIIVDGGSKDGTLDIIKKYENKIDYWQSEPDKGIYDAMNKGIGLASGEWVNFMNAGDEFVSNEIIKDIFARVYSYSKYDVIYGNTLLRWNDFNEEVLPNKDKDMPFCHQSCFTKTVLLQKFKFDVQYKICADRNFYHQLTLNNLNNYLYINRSVAFFDCTASYSTSNRIKLYKETAIINNHGFICYLYNMNKIYFKLLIEKLFPSILMLYRKHRSKKK